MVQRLSLSVFALRSDVHTGVRGQVHLIKIKKGYTSKIEVRSVTIFSGVLVQVVSVSFQASALAKRWTHFLSLHLSLPSCLFFAQFMQVCDVRLGHSPSSALLWGDFHAFQRLLFLLFCSFGCKYFPAGFPLRIYYLFLSLPHLSFPVHSNQFEHNGLVCFLREIVIGPNTYILTFRHTNLKKPNNDNLFIFQAIL